MRTVLLVSNRNLDEPGGRPDSFRTRVEQLRKYGWETQIAHVPEPFTRSVPRVVAKYARLARSNDIDVINGVCSPPELQIVALLVSELSGCPYLAEFRDPLTGNPDVDSSSISSRLRSVLESLIVRRADQIVWGDGIQISDEHFEQRYGDLVSAKWYKLPFVGYDSQVFNKTKTADFESFTVTYAGSFYEGWIEPYRFLEGYRRFIDEHDLTPQDTQFLVYGDWSEEYSEAVETLQLSQYLDTNDRVLHEEVVPILKGSDVLLYIGGQSSRNRLSLPSKIGDYIGTSNPILAVVDPEFRSGRFVREQGLGLVADPSDPDEIAAHLGTIYTDEFDLEPEARERFRRERKIEEFAEVLDFVSNGETKHGLWHED